MDDDCAGVACQNGGSCVLVRGRPLCRCADDWAGVGCDSFRGRTNVCRDLCLHGGVCVSASPLDAPRCHCPYNWSGPRCQHATLCQQHFCFNGGTCWLNPDHDLKPSCTSVLSSLTLSNLT